MCGHSPGKHRAGHPHPVPHSLPHIHPEGTSVRPALLPLSDLKQLMDLLTGGT